MARVQPDKGLAPDVVAEPGAAGDAWVAQEQPAREATVSAQLAERAQDTSSAGLAMTRLARNAGLA